MTCYLGIDGIEGKGIPKANTLALVSDDVLLLQFRKPILDTVTLIMLRITVIGIQDKTLHPLYHAGAWLTYQSEGVSVPVTTIQSLLEGSGSDTLLLYNSCHAANTAVTRYGNGSTTELIAACGFEATTDMDGPFAFATTLYDTLVKAYDNQIFPVSVSDLFTEMLNTTRRLRDRAYGASTPIHSTLTSSQNGRRITLQPLWDIEAKGPENVRLAVVLSLGIGFHEGFDIGTEAWDKAWKEWILKAPHDAKILLGAHVLGNTSN